MTHPPPPPASLTERFHRLAAPLLPTSTPLLAAVSGGSDSVALLHLLLTSGHLPRERLVVAHFHHNLRPDADLDARFVEEVATHLGVRFMADRWTHPPERGNRAEQARQARYAFLLHAARMTHATHVATGHQRDDQAETVLERLLRGSGVGGLAGMRPQRPLGEGVTLIRPLLPFDREELRTWLRQQNLPWREDPSNDSTLRTRGQLRHRLLPLLSETLGEESAPGLARTARRLAQADSALEWMTERSWPDLDPQWDGPALRLAIPPLLSLPEELNVRLLRRAHQAITGAEHPPGSRAWEGVLGRLAQPRRRWHMRIRGARIVRENDLLILEPARHAPRGGDGNG